MIETHTFARLPFHVKAVQVTNDNMAEVAAWCQGEIKILVDEETNATKDRWIKVKVRRPENERQTHAFVGDWVLFAGAGFKVYTNKAFEKSFEQVGQETTVFSTEQTAYRDASSGEFVTKEYAAEHADTTVGETLTIEHERKAPTPADMLPKKDVEEEQQD